MPTDENQQRAPFPPWLRELCYFGGLIVVLTMYLLSMKSDLRSTAEKVDRVGADVAAFSQRLSGLEGRLPNKEADELKYKTLEEKVDRNKSDADFSIAKLEKFKDDMTRALVKKGVIE